MDAVILADATSNVAGTSQLSGPPIRPRSDTTWIYFLGIDQNRIKIGESKQKRGKRRAQHERGTLGIRLNIDELCEVRGKVADERELHKYFASHLWPGEQEVFYAAGPLIDYIRWLRDQWWVAVPELTDAERDALPAVDSTHWLPSIERRKQKPSEVLPGMLGVFDLGQREVTADDFYTNELIIDAARRVMGRIDLDPASHAVANKVVQADRFFTISDNGLTHRWHGKVWLNPPFSAWAEWVAKVLKEWRAGHVEEMCVLSAMRTVTAQYFAPLLAACDAMCVVRGRIRFWGGVAGDSPDDGHAIYYFGAHRDVFREVFSELGTVFFSSREAA